MVANRILIVGPIDNELTELKMAFESLGLAVTTAADGLNALEKGKECLPDLIISEILIDRLSGFELSSRISSGAADFSATVMFYTEFYRDERARHEVLSKYGGAAYFVKPFQKEALRKAVVGHFQEFLSQRQSAATEPSTQVQTEPTPEALLMEKSLFATASAQTAAARSETAQPPRPAGLEESIPPVKTPLQSGSEMPTASSPFEKVPERNPGSSSSRVNVAESSLQARSLQNRLQLDGGRGVAVSSPSRLSQISKTGVFRVFALGVVVLGLTYVIHNRILEQRKQPTQPLQIKLKSTSNSETQPAEETKEAKDNPSPKSSSDAVSEGAKTLPDAVELPPQRTLIPQTPEKASDMKKSKGADDKGSVSIADVTGVGRGPILRRAPYPRFSAEALASLGEKALVLRLVVDGSGKVVDVTPLNSERSQLLSANVMETILAWRFSPSKSGEESRIKYYSFRAR